MILLSENGKTFVQVDSWDDIVTRPGYVEKIDPSTVKLKQILGRYNISPQQPCGIKNCRTAHNMGFLVLCEGGLETNIGRHCGKNIFGVDFQKLERIFTQDTNAQRYRQNISTFKNAIQGFFPQIDFLMSGDKQAFYCIEKIHFQVTKGFEQKTLDKLLERARRNDTYIKNTIALVGEERRIAIESKSSLYREEFLTTINGLQALNDYRLLKILVSSTFDTDLKIFLELNEESLELKDLKHWNSWVNNFEKKLKKAREIVADCHRFLEPSNRDAIVAYKHLL